MGTGKKSTIVVTGATGRQGSAVTRHLLKNRWRVRALTRNPKSRKALALAAIGAEVVQGDMGDPASLQGAFEGGYGVYSVQNPMISGLEAEVRQGKLVAEVAKQVGISHLVYGSAGFGTKGTAIGSWESKLAIEEHMKNLDIPLTILRPMAFMELMTDKAFYPAVSTWHVMPKLMGQSNKVGWLCTDDLGAIASRIFAEPQRFIGKDLKLTSDVQSIDECRSIYRSVMGKTLRRFPMPIWMFERIVGTDLTTMWRWLHTATINLDTGPTRAIHPQASTVEAWLRSQGHYPLARV